MIKKSKGLHSVVASLLLTVAVVAAIGMLYIWSGSYGQEKTGEVSEQIINAANYAIKQKTINVFKLTTTGKIYIENLGDENFTLSSLAIDNNAIVISQTLIEPGTYAIIDSNLSLADTNSYRITITTTNNIGKTIKQTART